MEKQSIFRKESLNRISSPEQLDDYIRVSKPSVWLILCALLIIAAAVLIWGFVGTLPKTVIGNGLLIKEKEVICFVGAGDFNADIIGCKAKISTPDNKNLNGVVTNISSFPYSAMEISEMHEGDWLRQKLVTNDYSYQITVKLDKSASYVSDMIVGVTLIVEETKPISYILN